MLSVDMETIRRLFAPGAEYTGRDIMKILEKYAKTVSVKDFYERKGRGRLTYICSPYHAESDSELQRNIEYARELTRMVLMRGDVPITTHLYLPQCADDSNPEERSAGLNAGMSLLRCCNHMVVGVRYGISKGMEGEIQCAEDGGSDIEWLP